MSLKDIKTASVVLPFHYCDANNSPTTASVLVEVDREGQTTITMQGIKHANAFLDMILTQQLMGFSANQQAPQSGIPGHDVEVTMDADTPYLVCSKHIPIQHRDDKEPWCEFCKLNKDFNPPRKIAFGSRPPQIGESLRRYEEGEGREGTR